MISCADFLARLSDYLDGEVAGEVRARLEMHLSHCRSCTVVVDSTRKTIRVLTDSDCFELPENVCNALSEHIIGCIQNAVVEGDIDELSTRSSP